MMTLEEDDEEDEEDATTTEEEDEEDDPSTANSFYIIAVFVNGAVIAPVPDPTATNTGSSNLLRSSFSSVYLFWASS